jgi:hypothetical protein
MLLKNLTIFHKSSNISKISSHFSKFLKMPSRNIYYDNLEHERNMDFMFNIGYNDLSSKIKPNIGFFKLTKFLMKRKLMYLIRHYYKHLIQSIEKGEVQIFDEILEKNLKYALYLDLTRLTREGYTFRVVNNNEPIFIKILNIFELDNVSINREENPEVSEYDLEYSRDGSIISMNQYDAMEELKLEGRSYLEIQKEKEAFEKSEYKEITYRKLYEEAKVSYAMNYLKTKLGSQINEKNAEYISNLIQQLDKKEKKFDPYSIELKSQFADYYCNKEKHIEDKLKKTDLYDYFRMTMPSNYESFLQLHKVKNGFLKRFINSIRQRYYRNYIYKSKRISKEKTLFVMDVEVTSKMRLELVDREGNNVLESQYNYMKRMKRNFGGGSKFFNNNELLKYDTSIYNFSVSERKWNYNNKEFLQSHILRIEFEKKNKFQNIFKKPYINMMITDIDFSLKGNKHFKFTKTYL